MNIKTLIGMLKQLNPEAKVWVEDWQELDNPDLATGVYFTADESGVVIGSGDIPSGGKL